MGSFAILTIKNYTRLEVAGTYYSTTASERDILKY